MFDYFIPVYWLEKEEEVGVEKFIFRIAIWSVFFLWKGWLFNGLSNKRQAIKKVPRAIMYHDMSHGSTQQKNKLLAKLGQKRGGRVFTDSGNNTNDN